MKPSVKTYNEFVELTERHFSLFRCNHLSATRESVLSFIPRLAQYTQIEVDCVFVYRSTSRSSSWCRVYFSTPLLTTSALYSCETVCMTPSALLGFLSKLSCNHSLKTFFYNV